MNKLFQNKFSEDLEGEKIGKIQNTKRSFKPCGVKLTREKKKKTSSQKAIFNIHLAKIQNSVIIILT